MLLRLLASPGMNVFGVGDDDQVIYGYAGADPEYLIGFEDLFPGAGTHTLEVNYRCPECKSKSAIEREEYDLLSAEDAVWKNP